jgi:hypothetical protein
MIVHFLANFRRDSTNAFSVLGFNRRDLRAPYDGGRRQTSLFKIGDCNIVTPSTIGCARNHEHPQKSMIDFD